MADHDLASRIAGVSALADPVRRALYQFVVRRAEPVSRDQAAAGVALPRHTAKFHLDRLVDEGLLDTEFRRLSGRRGPGAGRPAKLYRRSDRQLEVTLPERRYDVAGQILAEAVDRAAVEGIPVLTAVEQAATEVGRRLGGDRGAAEEAGTTLPAVVQLLAGRGYEPRTDGESIVLVNCPFHALARDHTALVCGMNLHLIRALLEAAGCSGVEAVLDPGEGRCCVRLIGRAGQMNGCRDFPSPAAGGEWMQAESAPG